MHLTISSCFCLLFSLLCFFRIFAGAEPQIITGHDFSETECTELIFISRCENKIEGLDLFYFMKGSDTILIMANSDSVPLRGIRNSEVELLSYRGNYRIPISLESSTAALLNGLAFRLPSPDGISLFEDSELIVSIPKLTELYSTTSINSGFIDTTICK